MRVRRKVRRRPQWWRKNRALFTPSVWDAIMAVYWFGCQQWSRHNWTLHS